MSTNEEKIEKVVIIGSGPAGFTAAIYAARATLNPSIYKGSAPNIPGGQLMLTWDVENFPGFPSGVLGPKLMESFEEQAIKFGAKAHFENVSSVDFKKRPLELTLESGKIVKSHSVIIATGANAKLLGIAKEKELMAAGAGVSACATCDGAFYKNVDVAVVGGGDSAMEEANFLTRYAKSVHVIHRREEFRASKIMYDRAKNNPKIKWHLNATVKEIVTTTNNGKESLSGLILQSMKDNKETNLSVEGLFVAIGHKPNTDLFKGKLALDEKGYIQTKDKSSKTEIEGVFACGDVQDSVYRQAVTAAGSGCMAAIDAERFLESNGL